MRGAGHDSGLRACQGYAVYASDGKAGEVEAPLFSSGSARPDYVLLLVRRRGRLFPSFSVLPAALVEHVDQARRQLRVAATRRMIASLPRDVPAGVRLLEPIADPTLRPSSTPNLQTRWQPNSREPATGGKWRTDTSSREPTTGGKWRTGTRAHPGRRVDSL